MNEILKNLTTTLQQLNQVDVVQDALKEEADPNTQLRLKTSSFFMKCMHTKRYVKMLVCIARVPVHRTQKSLFETKNPVI